MPLKDTKRLLYKVFIVWREALIYCSLEAVVIKKRVVRYWDKLRYKLRIIEDDNALIYLKD